MDEAAVLKEMRLVVEAEKNGGEPAGWAEESGSDVLNLVCHWTC